MADSVKVSLPTHCGACSSRFGPSHQRSHTFDRKMKKVYLGICSPCLAHVGESKSEVGSYYEKHPLSAKQSRGSAIGSKSSSKVSRAKSPSHSPKSSSLRAKSPSHSPKSSSLRAKSPSHSPKSSSLRAKSPSRIPKPSSSRASRSRSPSHKRSLNSISPGPLVHPKLDSEANQSSPRMARSRSPPRNAF
jgi:hypothetical protein